jgi:glutaryl-CoA dehydrogenase
MDEIEYGLIMQELERGDSGLRSFASVQSSLCMYPIHRFGTEEQKQKYLSAMAKAQIIGCFGLSEPDFGSNPAGMLTRAERKGSSFVLNGTKRWITNGSIAQVAVIWAKLDDEIQGFLVPTDSKGFLARDIPGKLSLRASVTSELILDQCEISEDCLLPGAKGLKAALQCLSSARYGIVWGALGAALACYDEALQYAKERIMFGGPIAGKQMVQSKLVWMATEISKAQLLAYRLGQLKEAGAARPQQISMGKMNNVGVALQVARLSRDILGANGVSDEYQCMRHMCNLESVNTYEGTYDIHQLIVGESITGISAF